MTILQCGFDKTAFPDSVTWMKIIGPEHCKLYGYKELPDEKGFLWTGHQIKVLTGDDPLTGESRIKALNHPGNIKQGVAGYIGIKGESQAVLEFVGLVFLHAKYVKDFDPKASSFIALPADL